MPPTPIESKIAGNPFLQRLDTFLGHLKKPFAPKPGFFIHDLIFVLFAALEIYILFCDIRSAVLIMSAYHQIQTALSAMQANTSQEYIAMSVASLVPIAFDLFLLIQVWRFLRKTPFSWIMLSSASWSVILTHIIVIISQSIAFASMDSKNKFDAAYYTLHELHWLILSGLLIFLLARKKIRAMHKINPRNFFLTPLYGLLWLIITGCLTWLVALPFLE